MTATTVPAPRGTTALEQLALRGGVALIGWSRYHTAHRPTSRTEAARLAREASALDRWALLVPMR